mmetsp:Transcript_11584/g.16539  ORF Transcript_11584/g.16539 Transcript_11584/m.16539 type:complete len:386 (+) Transcript_11584:208-1365(+)
MASRRKRDRKGSDDLSEDDPSPKSPILPVLDAGVAEKYLVHRQLGRTMTYVGFTEWKHMATAVEGNSASFESMASNRLINQGVVLERIALNEESLKRCGTYMDFGTVIFIVVSCDPRAVYRIMDGQHRVRTMQELFRRRPETPLPFSLQVSVVPDEAAAHAELMHFQVHHPADPRAFFGNQKEREGADALLARARQHFEHVSLWKEHASGRFGRADPVRPYLSDYVFLGLLQEAQLLDMRVDAAWEVLLSANRLLKESPACRGKNATDAMGDKAGKYQCYLGFLREGLWREVRPKLPAVLFQGVGSASDVAAAAAAAAEAAVAAAAAAALSECCVCFEKNLVKDLYALVPCGHRCVCARHAADAVGRACPLCRKKATSVMRIYDS